MLRCTWHRAMGIRVGFLLLVILLGGLVWTPPAWAQGGGRFVVGENYVLRAGERLMGGLAVFGGSAVLEPGSEVIGDVAIAGGNLDVAGRVSGDVAVLGGNLILREDAVVLGDVAVLGGSLERHEGAQIMGDVAQGGEGFALPGLDRLGWPAWPRTPLFPFFPFLGGLTLLQNVIMALFSALAMAALGVLLLLVLEKPVRRVQHTLLAAPWASIGMGLLTFVAVLSVGVVLAITICLSPVALLLALALALAILMGWTAAGFLLGERMLAAFKVNEPSPLLSVVAGVSVLSLLTRVPCVGWFLFLVVASFGLGAVVLTRAGTVPYPVNGRPALCLAEEDAALSQLTTDRSEGEEPDMLTSHEAGDSSEEGKED